MSQLSKQDAKDYARLKGVILAGISTFIEVGNALAEINDRQLYLEEYETFAAFVEQEYDRKKSWAYQLIDATKVEKALSSVRNCGQQQAENGQKLKSEYAYRELGKVDEKQIPEVYEKAATIANEQGKPITAAIVKQAVKDVVPRAFECEVPTEPEVLTEAEVAVQNATYHREIAANLNECRRMLKSVPDQPGMDKLQVAANSIMRDIDNAKAGLLGTTPKAVCPRCEGAKCAQCGNHGWVNSTLLRELTRNGQ